jgi:putative intracellular protease/amidase
MTGASPFPPTRHVGILVFDKFEPLDVWGFVEAFSISRFIGTGYASGPPYPFEVKLISNATKPKSGGSRPAPVESMNGPSVAPDLFRDEALHRSPPFDLLMIPGGLGTRQLLGADPAAVEALVAWIQAMDASAPSMLMTSVCTGAAILARAGVLDGRPAATNHEAFAWVVSFGPRVLWDNVARWVDAGRYVTSAGVSAGTDMAFHLVSRLAGRAVAEMAAISAEYDWRRDPNQPTFYPQQAAVPTGGS